MFCTTCIFNIFARTIGFFIIRFSLFGAYNFQIKAQQLLGQLMNVIKAVNNHASDEVSSNSRKPMLESILLTSTVSLKSHFTKAGESTSQFNTLHKTKLFRIAFSQVWFYFGPLMFSGESITETVVHNCLSL